MKERRRFILAGYGVFDDVMRPVDAGEQIEVVKMFPGDKRKKIEALSDHDWIQIEEAARGCISGTSDEWPDLVRAIEKVHGRKLMRQPSAWLRGFCEALVLFR